MLKDVTIYLEGMYKGAGNIKPLEQVHLENLWNIIHHLKKNEKV